MTAAEAFARAFDAKHIEDLLSILPDEWAPIRARIIESGVTLSPTVVPWAPRWTPVSPTIRGSNSGSPKEMMVKSVIYRIHDCIHQLWGLRTDPVVDAPLRDFNRERRSLIRLPEGW